MKIDRSQTLVTHSVNEMLAIWCNDVQYKNAQMEAIECGQDSAFRLKFKEGSYCDHVSQFDSVPYISAYMLGYSKMLMAASFQFITKIGGTLLYTDTDSIAAKNWALNLTKYIEIQTLAISPLILTVLGTVIINQLHRWKGLRLFLKWEDLIQSRMLMNQDLSIGMLYKVMLNKY